MPSLASARTNTWIITTTPFHSDKVAGTYRRKGRNYPPDRVYFPSKYEEIETWIQNTTHPQSGFHLRLVLWRRNDLNHEAGSYTLQLCNFLDGIEHQKTIDPPSRDHPQHILIRPGYQPPVSGQRDVDPVPVVHPVAMDGNPSMNHVQILEVPGNESAPGNVPRPLVVADDRMDIQRPDLYHNGNGDGHLSTSLIVGIACSSALVLFVAVIALIWYFRRRANGEEGGGVRESDPLDIAIAEVAVQQRPRYSLAQRFGLGEIDAVTRMKDVWFRVTRRPHDDGEHGEDGNDGNDGGNTDGEGVKELSPDLFARAGPTKDGTATKTTKSVIQTITRRWTTV